MHHERKRAKRVEKTENEKNTREMDHFGPPFGGGYAPSRVVVGVGRGAGRGAGRAPDWPLARLLQILDDATSRTLRTAVRAAPQRDERDERQMPQMPQMPHGPHRERCDLYARKAICHLRRADEHVLAGHRGGRRGKSGRAAAAEAAAAHHARAREYAQKAACIRCGERDTIKYMQGDR